MLAATLSIAPCALAESSPERVDFFPGWFASAQFAGVYVALDQGLYADSGLAVELHPFAFGRDQSAAFAPSAKTCAVGSIEGYILLQRHDRGVDLVALAPMLRQSPAGVMSLAESGIVSAADFAGRTIGVHAYADALFAWFATRAGLTPDQTRFVRVQDDIAAVLRGEVDAMQGYASEEYVRFQNAAAPRETRFLSFAELGFPSYSEILYTSREQLHRHHDTIRRFVAVTRRGWQLAFADPAAAVDAIVRHSPSDTDRHHLAASLAALRPFVMGDDDRPLPAMDLDRWSELQHIAAEMGLIETTPADPANWVIDLDQPLSARP